MTRVFAIQFK